MSEISARGNREAHRLARLYAAMIRALVIQQTLRAPAGAPDWLRGIDWTNETYPLRVADMERTRCAGTVQVRVEVAYPLDRRGGPRVPRYPPTPAPDAPEPMLMREVETHETQVTKQEDE